MASSPLGELVSISGGGTPSKSKSAYFEGNIPWVTPKDMKGWEIWDSQDHISETAIAESATKLVAPGSVLVVVRSGVLKHSLPIAINRVPVTVNQDLKVLTCGPKLLPEYLARYLQSAASRLLAFVRGTTADNIPVDELRSLDVPHPPLPEQRRIADILDKADAVRRRRKEAVALTEELLRSAFLDMFGDIPAKRSKWKFVPLREFLSASSGKSSKPVLSSNETGIPVYGGNGINGWATEALYKKPVVVVGRVGQQCGITRLTDGPAWVTDNAIVVNVERPDVLSPVYLMTALQHSPLRASVMRLDLPFINQSTILDYPLPLPPLAEQERFARWRAQVLVTKERLRGGSAVAARLFDALVQQAFRGELGRA